MAAPAEDLAAAIGKQFADDVPGRLLQRSVKLGAAAAAQVGDQPPDGGFQKFDVTEAMGFGAGVQASIIAPQKFGEAPELFWGPFMQLGTYLGIEDPVLRFITDAVVDPTNLALPGTNFLLNRTGEVAKLITTATKGGRAGKTMEAAIKGVEDAIQVASAAVHNEDLGKQLLGLVRTGKGSKSEIKALAKQLLEADIDDASRATIDALAKNRKAFSRMLTIQEQMEAAGAAGRELGPSMFLQPTIAGRVKAGQVNPLLRIEKPFTMTRQLLGIGYRDTELFVPVTREIAGGIGRGFDAFRGNAIRTAEDLLLPELRTSSVDTFGKIAGLGGKTTLHDIQDMADFYTVVNENASETVASMMGLSEDLSDEALQPAWRLYKQGNKDTAFPEFRELVLQRSLRSKEDAIDALNKQRAARMEEFLGRVEGRAFAQDIPRAEVEERLAAFQAARSMFDMGNMVHDGMGLAHAISARVNFGTIMANQLNFGINDTIRTMFKKRGRVEPARELFGRIIDTPQAFEIRDGRMFLKPGWEPSKEQGGFLGSLFSRHPDLRDSLLTDGVPMELWETAQIADDVLKRLGTTLFEHEGVIGGMTQSYLQRVFRFKDKNLKGSDEIRKWLDDQLADTEGVFQAMHKLARKKEGKLDFAEHRKALEDALVRMEGAGLGTYDKDGVALFTEYMYTANRAITTNIMWRDLTQLAPRMGVEDFKRAGVNLSERVYNRIQNAGGVLKEGGYKRLPREAQRAYVKFSTAPRFGFPTVQQQASVAVGTAAARGDLDRFVTRTVRAKLADEALSPGGKELRKAIFQNETGKLRKPGQIVSYYTDDEVRDFLERGQIPAQVYGSGKMNKRLRAEIRSREYKFKKEQVKGIRKTQEAVREAGPRREAIYVHKAIEPQVSEVLRTFGDERLLSGKLLRGYGKLNAALKSTVLLFDVFHYNVLSFTQMVMNPGQFARVLTEPGMVRGSLAKAGAGAALGGTIGALQGQDAEGIAATSVAGALWASSLRAARQNALNMRRGLMNPRHADTLAWMALGGFTGKPSDRAIGMAGRWLEEAAARLKNGPAAARLLVSPVDGLRHVIEGFDQEMWEYLQVGSKQLYFDRVFQAQVAKLPQGLSNTERFQRTEQIARETMQTANIMLGGQRFSLLLGHPEWADVSRHFMLSPDWTTSRLAGASAVFMNMNLATSAGLGAMMGHAAELADAGWDQDHISGMGWAGGATIGALSTKWMDSVRRRMGVPGDLMAKEARRIYGSALLGIYFFSNLLNMAFAGKPMWDNPEGKKLSIDMGARDHLGREQFVTLGKPWKEAFEFGSIIEQEKYPIPVWSRTASKMAVLPRMGIQLLTNDSGLGPIVQPEMGPFERLHTGASFVLKSVSPIVSSGPVRLAAESEFFGGSGAGGVELARSLTRLGGFSTSSGRRDRISLEALANFTAPSPPGLGSFSP